MIYEVEMTFDGDASSVTGMAQFSYEVIDAINSDIGGIDGKDVTGCELYKVVLDGSSLHLSFIERMMGKTAFAKMEADVRDEIQALVNSGDL